MRIEDALNGRNDKLWIKSVKWLWKEARKGVKRCGVAEEMWTRRLVEFIGRKLSWLNWSWHLLAASRSWLADSLTDYLVGWFVACRVVVLARIRYQRAWRKRYGHMAFIVSQRRLTKLCTSLSTLAGRNEYVCLPLTAFVWWAMWKVEKNSASGTPLAVCCGAQRSLYATFTHLHTY